MKLIFWTRSSAAFYLASLHINREMRFEVSVYGSLSSPLRNKATVLSPKPESHWRSFWCTLTMLIHSLYFYSSRFTPLRVVKIHCFLCSVKSKERWSCSLKLCTVRLILGHFYLHESTLKWILVSLNFLFGITIILLLKNTN